ncbi:D-lactate dehydrogenase [Serratia fonticola]|uniref:D-lactate dehydrogenase n=1 Tax=Serratia fonticola TaxID=47917 RepID=A0A4U9W220_SERFO|nr:D-lactate dehydrogenase [Serratia fonticola]
MPRFFTLKGRVDATLNKLPLIPHNLTDNLMQKLSKLALTICRRA